MLNDHRSGSSVPCQTWLRLHSFTARWCISPAQPRNWILHWRQHLRRVRPKSLHQEIQRFSITIFLVHCPPPPPYPVHWSPPSPARKWLSPWSSPLGPKVLLQVLKFCSVFSSDVDPDPTDPHSYGSVDSRILHYIFNCIILPILFQK